MYTVDGKILENTSERLWFSCDRQNPVDLLNKVIIHLMILVQFSDWWDSRRALSRILYTYMWTLKYHLYQNLSKGLIHVLMFISLCMYLLKLTSSYWCLHQQRSHPPLLLVLIVNFLFQQRNLLLTIQIYSLICSVIEFTK